MIENDKYDWHGSGSNIKHKIECCSDYTTSVVFSSGLPMYATARAAVRVCAAGAVLQHQLVSITTKYNLLTTTLVSHLYRVTRPKTTAFVM